MPKYIFKCEACELSKTAYVSVKVIELNCECGKEAGLKRQLPSLAGQEVRETVDTLTGVTWKQDQQSLLKKRHEDYYWEKEVPRLVQQYSIETCLENKWLVYNEKGELVINKPPSKR